MSDTAIIAMLCGLAAAISWGLADFWAAKASKTIGPATSVIAVNTIGLAVFTLFYFLSGNRGPFITDAFWYAAGAGLALGAGLMIFYHALKAGPVSLVSPLSSAYPLVTTLLVVLLFQADLSARQIGGIAIVMVGILAASELFSVRGAERRLGRGPLLALGATTAWGICWALMAQAVETMDWQTASLVQIIFVFLITVVMAPLIKDNEKVLTKNTLRSFRNPVIVLAGLLQMFGMVIVNVGVGLDSDFAPAVAAVSACYPVLTIFLALKHFKEDFKLIPLAGALVTIGGVIVLSLG
jgi:drug/metabolite transporter (DMT)-like permease